MWWAKDIISGRTHLFVHLCLPHKPLYSSPPFAPNDHHYHSIKLILVGISLFICLLLSRNPFPMLTTYNCKPNRIMQTRAEWLYWSIRLAARYFPLPPSHYSWVYAIKLANTKWTILRVIMFAFELCQSSLPSPPLYQYQYIFVSPHNLTNWTLALSLVWSLLSMMIPLFLSRHNLALPPPCPVIFN